MNLAELESKTIDELQDLAKELDISGYSRLKKQELAFRILQAQTEQQGNIFAAGVLEIMDEGFGFLRQDGRFLPGHEDIYVSQSQIRRFGLRTGDRVSGQVRPPASMVRVIAASNFMRLPKRRWLPMVVGIGRQLSSAIGIHGLALTIAASPLANGAIGRALHDDG